MKYKPQLKILNQLGTIKSAVDSNQILQDNFLKNIKKPTTIALVEVLLNTIKSKIPVNSQFKSKLKKHKKFLRNICNKKLSVKKIKKQFVRNKKLIKLICKNFIKSKIYHQLLKLSSNSKHGK